MIDTMIHLPMINLCPTMRCNLRCKLCGVLVPQYDFRPHMSIAEFQQSLNAVFEVVDTVGKLQITGGEPLLHKNLDDMLEGCFKYSDQFDKLWLFTNSAVKMSEAVLKILGNHKDKTLVHCSDYGVEPDTTAELIQTLSENGIHNKYLKYYGDGQYFDGWVDQGDFVCHNRTESELSEVFRNCAHIKRGGSWYVRNGQMHFCGRSIRGVEVSKIPDCKEDYLDIFSGTTEERRKKLQTLMNKTHITACDYCNGLYGTEDANQRFAAGEQIV